MTREELVEMYGEDYVNALDEAIEEYDYEAKPTLREKVIKRLESVVNNRFLWYVSGFADCAILYYIFG